MSKTIPTPNKVQSIFVLFVDWRVQNKTQKQAVTKPLISRN